MMLSITHKAFHTAPSSIMIRHKFMANLEKRARHLLTMSLPIVRRIYFKVLHLMRWNIEMLVWITVLQPGVHGWVTMPFSQRYITKCSNENATDVIDLYVAFLVWFGCVLFGFFKLNQSQRFPNHSPY